MSDVRTLLGLDKPPIAVAFLNAPPPGLPAWNGGEAPAGCFFWKKAWEGHTFYTTPADHYNCAVGAHTHHIPLPAARSEELGQTVGFMVENGYIAPAEVPGIPVLPDTPAAIAYGPADGAPFAPDVVVVAARPAQAMLLTEAALKAGAATSLVNTLGRPGCAVLPLTLQLGSAALSLGCMGNRTFTGLPDTEIYLSIPGDKWPAVVEQVAQIHASNRAMGGYYRQRKTQFPVS